MTPLDPSTLPGMPAPFWFVQLFKGIGFGLHAIPMGLWFAGLPVAIMTLLFGRCVYSKRYAKRMLSQMPIFLALGINFGIVPLLFLQVTYYKPFYTATILTAWHWICVIPILLIGYYSVYAASFAIKGLYTGGTCEPGKFKIGKPGLKAIGFGLLASLSFAAIGLLMSNGITLMERPDAWVPLWERTNIAGATSGTGNNMRDPALWRHLLTMFLLGTVTTAIYAVVDSHFFLKAKSDEDTAYRNWTLKFAALLGIIGAVAFSLVFLEYLGMLLPKFNEHGKTIPGLWYDVKYEVGTFWIFALFMSLAAAVGSVFLVMSGKKSRLGSLILMIGSYLVFMVSFVVIRQTIQNVKISKYVKLNEIPVDVQWSPLIVFLIVFVLGAAVIAWMVRQIYICEKS